MFAVSTDVFQEPRYRENVAVGAIRVATGSMIFGLREMGVIKGFHHFLNHACDAYERAGGIFQLQRIAF